MWATGTPGWACGAAESWRERSCRYKEPSVRSGREGVRREQDRKLSSKTWLDLWDFSCCGYSQYVRPDTRLSKQGVCSHTNGGSVGLKTTSSRRPTEERMSVLAQCAPVR